MEPSAWSVIFRPCDTSCHLGDTNSLTTQQQLHRCSLFCLSLCLTDTYIDISLAYNLTGLAVEFLASVYMKPSCCLRATGWLCQLILNVSVEMIAGWNTVVYHTPRIKVSYKFCYCTLLYFIGAFCQYTRLLY